MNRKKNISAIGIISIASGVSKLEGITKKINSHLTRSEKNNE